MCKEPTLSAQHALQSYDEYLSKRDNVLGWPFPTRFGGKVFDSTGSRRIPAFEDPNQHQNCVSLYGDSFTFGTDVDHEHAWGNVLSQQLNCRIANFASGGYGTDQAYLRFQHNHKDKSSIVVLGHTSIDIIRNLTRNRDLCSSNMNYALKPRFILDVQGKLKLIPIPKLSEKAYQKLVGLDSPQLELVHENFLPDGYTGMTKLQLPYIYAVLKNLNDFRLRSKLAQRPSHAEFYTKGHPLRGLEITTQIIKSFFHDAKQQDRSAAVILFATIGDLKFYKKNHLWTYQNLMEALDTHNIPYLNVGEHLLKYLGQRKVGEIFHTPLGGHYNEEGNQVVADFVYAHIKHLVFKQTNKQEQ
jgi:lysophospholipase L1-like esterase